MTPSPRTAAKASPTAIAIVGMAGVMPGSEDLEEFWRHLADGHDLTRTVPQDRTDLRENPDTAGVRAGFLDDVRSFDAALFGVSPKEAALMDPQQRLFLQTVWRTIEDAGYRPSDLAGSATGLFAGVSACDYDDLLRDHGVPVEAHTASGVASCILANRVSYVLDLRGPSEAVDTACSSSLVALHRAARAIMSGECDMAIAGGVNLTLSPGLYVAFGKSGMLSADGTCKTFDETRRRLRPGRGLRGRTAEATRGGPGRRRPRSRRDQGAARSTTAGIPPRSPRPTPKPRRASSSRRTTRPGSTPRRSATSRRTAPEPGWATRSRSRA